MGEHESDSTGELPPALAGGWGPEGQSSGGLTGSSDGAPYSAPGNEGANFSGGGSSPEGLSSGGLTGSSDGAPYSAPGNEGATSSDIDPGAGVPDISGCFGCGPYAEGAGGALMTGVIEGIAHVVGDELGFGAPVIIVPEEPLHEFMHPGDTYNY